MGQSIPIEIREFWDVPRIFLAPYQGKLFLFDCVFDETTEDFPDYYQVYQLPDLRREDLAGSWAQLSTKAVHSFGKVPIQRISFDPMKRRQIGSTILDELTAGIAIG